MIPPRPSLGLLALLHSIANRISTLAGDAVVLAVNGMAVTILLMLIAEVAPILSAAIGVRSARLSRSG